MSDVDHWGGDGPFPAVGGGRRHSLQIPGALDGHPSSSPPTRDPAIDSWRAFTIAEAKAAGCRITCQCRDGWHIVDEAP